MPVTAGGGKAFYLGTHVPSDGSMWKIRRVILRDADHLRARSKQGTRVTMRESMSFNGDKLLDRYAKLRHPDLPVDEALSLMARENLRKYALGDPLGYAEFVVVKLARMWRRGFSEAMTPLLPSILHFVLAGLAVLGLLLLAWRRRWRWSAVVLGTPLLTTTLVTALLLNATSRRTVPMIPLMAVMAAAAVGWACVQAHAFARRRRRGGTDTPAPAAPTRTGDDPVPAASGVVSATRGARVTATVAAAPAVSSGQGERQRARVARE
jgi:hypothetical protein